MVKHKKIIIALCISFIITVLINVVITQNVQSKFIEIPIINSDLFKGDKLTEENVNIVKVKLENINNDLLKNNVNVEEINNYVLQRDMFKGEILTMNSVITKDQALESIENYQYVSIPVNKYSYSLSSKLNKGDYITVYYTAKAEDVTKILSDTKKIYSNSSSNGLVTGELIQKVQVISLHNNSGMETKEETVTDLIIRVTKEQAMLISNLKSQGTFDIALD